MRLDVYLTENNLTESRTRAKNLIELGFVTINGIPADKPSYEVRETDEVRVEKNYDASLGGIKLRAAIDEWSIDVCDKDCLDIGASNGGFCDVLLQNKAKKVIALDVGECALPPRLKNDTRIVVMDKTNARFTQPSDLPYVPEIISADVSFISITQILPTIYNCLKEGGTALCLIKPQFECGKKALSKNGVVLNKKEEEKAVSSVKECACKLGFIVRGVIAVPHPFANKNREYMIYLVKSIA